MGDFKAKMYVLNSISAEAYSIPLAWIQGAYC